MNKQIGSDKSVGKLLKKKDISEIVNTIMNSDEKLRVVYDVFSVTYGLCENIREKNFQVYSDSVEPEKIRLDFVKNKLNESNLTEEQEEKWLFELVTIGQSIQAKGDKYHRSNIEKFVLTVGGATLGALSMEIIRKIFTKK